MRRILVKLLGERLFASVKGVVDEVRIARNHAKGRAIVRRKFAGRRDLRVQFGCGPFPRKGWLNTDVWPGPWATPDFCVDVCRPLPFETESVIEMYSEHMFEHLDYPKAALPFLDECFRSLAPGGKMTIGVPDVEGVITRYVESSNILREPNDDERRYCVLGHPLERLNYSFHQLGEHKFLYSFDHLRQLLDHRGFVGIERRDWNAADDSLHRRDETLYVVAFKPNK